jgi:class 3 adenylate cyclase/tetratricopeptide (TPR) repeat protein
MTACASCGFENPAAFRFCGSCGEAIGGRSCPSCGASAPAGLRFCGQCGTSLDVVAAATGLEERKLATVLYADVVGFTSLSETADPELVARTVDAAFRRLSDVVDAHGGTVDKYVGDCLMAVFGVPVAHDDDAERAVAAGLAMRGLSSDLEFSIGINTGEVMVTAIGAREGVTVVGDTVNVAARLEKAAGADQVLVGELTAQLAAGHVSFCERPPMVLKGKREPVPVFEAVAVRDAGDGGDDGGHERALRPPLVGRDDDMAFLRAQWRRVRAERRATVVMLTGDAGVGKTRLIDELVDEAGAEGLVGRTTYPAYGGLGGPRVAADIIRQLGATGQVEIDARARSMGGAVDPVLRTLDATAIAQEQLWAFRRLLEAKSAERPLLIAIDDMHRAGDKMIEFLAELMARVIEVPVMLVLAGRPHGEWLGHFPSASTVRVSPLGRGDATALANALVPERPLGPSAAAALVDRAGGNPLYVRELIAMVHLQGGLVADNGHYELAAGLALPPSLQAILAARLDALGATEKTALQHVAVLGNGATDAQVERLGLVEARQSLRPLVAAGLLRQDGDGRYDVADPLLREVAYETLPRAVRAERHRQAADVAGSVEDQARHLDRAVGYRPDDDGLVGEAATALAAAGMQLLNDFRVIDGMRLLQRAVDLGYRAPIDLLRLARLYSELARNDEALAVLELVPVETGDATIDAERAHVAAWALQMRDPEATLAGLADAATRWAGLGNRAKEGWAHANRGVALFNMGRVAESQLALDTGLAIFQDVGHRPGVMAVYRFLALARPEDPRAADWLEEAFRDAEEKGDRNAQLSSLVSLAWHHFFRFRLGGRDRLDVIADLAARTAELGRELGADEFAAYGLCIGSNVARLRGDLDGAAGLARRASGLRLEGAPSTACLVRTVEFGARLARGEPVVAPELSRSTDPVASMAFVLQLEALLLAAREGPALRADRGNLEALQWLVGGIPNAWGKITGGDPEGAIRIAGVARRAAEAAEADPAVAAATALEAEARVRTGDHDGARRLLEPLGSTEGVAGLFVLRGWTALGDERAAVDLATAAATLAMPGLAAVQI